MKQFTLPAGTTNRHQWHKPAAQAVEEVTRTFDMMRQIYGQHGGESQESLVTVFHFGSEATKNPEAVKVYEALGERFGWAITKENADEVAEQFRGALLDCMETVPVEDNRTTPEEDAKRHEQTAQAAQARKVIAEELADEIEPLAEALRKKYPNAIGKDSGKSSHARAAANFKQILTAQGLRASVKSSSFSMGDSVTAHVLTPDLTPEQRKEIEGMAELFTYSTFDPYTDSSEYKNDAQSKAWSQVLGRTKYCRAEFTQSDELRAEIREFLGHDDADPHSSQPHQVWSGAHCRAAEFWEARAAAQPEPAAPSGTGYEVQKHHHTKKDFDFYIVVMAERVEREEFVRLRDSCRAAGGWYSRNFGKTPGGFAFNEREQAGAWAVQEFGGDTPPDDRPRVTPPEIVKDEDGRKAAKFREMAEKLTPQIEAKLGDRLTNTPKRQQEARSARIDGNRLERTQQALNALAALLESGHITPELRSFSSKKAIYEALGTVLGHDGGCYDYHDTGEPRTDTPEARALWALLEGKSDEEKAAEALRDQVEKLQFLKIPGYFPTPADLVADMLDHADIKTGHSVLEPSAGSGAITDQLADLHADPLIVVNEVNPTLCEILQSKGFDARPVNFLEDTGKFKYDRVVMNPPFEKLADIDHVRHAFGKLKDGGRLVSIMSPSPFFHTSKKAQQFREWFEELNGEVQDIEAGAFKESGTGVASKMVIIDKPEAERIPSALEDDRNRLRDMMPTQSEEPEQIALF